MNYSGSCAALLAASICGTLALLFVARRMPTANKVRGNNDIVGVYFTIIGTVYAIILAFMLASVWTRFDQARSQAEQEAATLVNIYRLSDGLPEANRTLLQKAVRDYAENVIHQEWPRMRNAQDSPEINDLHHQLWRLTQAIDPKTNRDTNIHAQMLQQLTTLATLRRLRLLTSDGGLPDILWFVLIAGAALLVGMTALFGEETYAHHSFKAVLLTTTLVLILYATWEIDGPFSGNITVTPKAFEEAVKVCDETK